MCAGYKMRIYSSSTWLGGGAGETVVHLILRAFQELVMNDMEAIEILEPVLRQFPDAMLAKNAVGVTPTDIALQVQGNSKIIRRYESDTSTTASNVNIGGSIIIMAHSLRFCQHGFIATASCFIYAHVRTSR